MHQQQQILTVVEEHGVSAVLDAAVVRYPFAEDVFEAAKWRIARDRECGVVVARNPVERRLIFIPSNKAAQSPGLLVRFFYREHEAVVDWIKFYDYDDGQASQTPKAYVA